ncbi:MAG: FAD-dependent oxidoreductase [Polyangiales bacterium]|nr:FAD-dependent oxidoreductase [Myxococcales bacterium]MCB9658623.1 FAD-dependent oxidoreductase [Sandaracinaceae bacterium]
MTQRNESVDVVVVGGGLAGLLVAEGLGRAGRRVVVLERSPAPGGRARTATHGAHRFNFGPHALYLEGPLHHALRAAGVSTAGVAPSLGGARALFADGHLDALPVGLGGVLRADWFGARDAREMLAALRRIRAGAGTSDLHETSAAAFIDALVTRDGARRMLATLVRLATYGGDPSELSADVAHAQLTASVRHGVRYVHGGWQSLVVGLLDRAARAGVTVRHARAASLGLEASGALQGRMHTVTDDHGRTLRAADVVLACAPNVAASLLDGADPVLAEFARGARPVTMRGVDLGLRDPGRDLRFTLGVDTPVYFSPQRGVRDVAPAGGLTVHTGVYLGAEGGDAVADPAGLLDAALERLVPDLAARTVERRVLARAVVHHALPDWRRAGMLGRPACASQVPGVWFAGDWVGPQGHLADAAAASAVSVVRGIAVAREGGLRCAS